MTPPALEPLVALLREICETPAPTFAEGARAELIARLWREAGLEPVLDAVGNVVAEAPGGAGPRVLVAAHLDTVFQGADVTVRRDGERLCAPGIGDNSASLAVLSRYAQELAAHPERPRLTLAATVGEEGMGDLRGMRELMRAPERWEMVVALDGHLGTVVDRSVGAKRFEVAFRARGGHSWGDYPSPSAVHALGDAIHALTRISVPREPRSSLNVGQVWGGTSVNAIAQEACLTLDVRSLDAEVLAGLEAEALTRLRRVARRQRVTLETEPVGDRPVALSENTTLVRAAKRALESAGLAARTAASSTDANAAMAARLPAVAFGVYRGGDAHRASEWLEPESLVVGYEAFARFMLELSRSQA